MSQLGERLRQARESQGLTIEQASLETRIRQQSLTALEEGRFDLIPNDVVVKGFLRNYAQVLHLPVDEVIDQYRLETGGSQPIQVVPTSSIPRRRSFDMPSFFGIFFVTIALVGLTYFVLSAAGMIRDEGLVSAYATPVVTSAAPTPTELSTPVPTASEEATATSATDDVEQPTSGAVAAAPEDQGTATPTATLTPFVVPTAGPAGAESESEATPTPTAEAPIVLNLSILPGTSEGSWVRVTADNQVVLERIMGPDEQQTFLAQRRVDIRAGNPTYVQVQVNGLQPETLGQVEGEPVDWSWPPQ